MVSLSRVWVSVLGLLVSAAALADCRTVQWQSGTEIPSALYADRIAFADFDGDGDREAVGIAPTVLNQPRTKVWFMPFGQPIGEDMRVIHTGSRLTGVAARDMNGDGKADVVLADQELAALVVLPGNGDGTFAAAVVTQVPDAPSTFTVAELTGDSHPDLAAGSLEPPVLTIHAGRGDGTFAATSRTAIPPLVWALRAADLDADHAIDLIASHFESTTMTVLFGTGAGGIASSVAVEGGRWGTDTQAGDLDGDGDLEVIAANYAQNTVSVNINEGGRAFRAPVAYNAAFGERGPIANPYALAIADFSGDGRPDVALATLNGRYIASFSGNGDGTLQPGRHQRCPTCTTMYSIDVLDDNGDGRLDLLVTSRGGIFKFRNECGAARIHFSTRTPTISAGQTIRLTTGVDGVAPVPIVPTGTLSIREGTTTLASTPAIWSTDLVVEGLSMGDHTLVVHYSGDEEYEPMTSTPVVVHVVAQQPAIILTQTSAQTTLAEELRINVRVTQDGADLTSGSLRVLVDGKQISSTFTPPQLSDHQLSLSAGTHVIALEYSGDATHAPATASITHSVLKGTTGVAFTEFPRPTVVQGQPVSVTVRLSTHQFTPVGLVRLMAGPMLYGSAALSSGFATITTTALPPGRHTVRIRYEGDANFHPAESSELVIDVTPAPTRRSRGIRH